MSDANLSTSRRTVLGGIAGTAVLPLVSGNADAASAALSNPVLGRAQPFDDGWRFRRGDGSGQEAPGLDDSAWRAVDLPHDWSIEDMPGKGTPFDDKETIGREATGFTIGGEGWYRKHFSLDGIAPNARVEIAFDGVYELADIWLNGIPVGSSIAGYSPFVLDLTPQLKRTGDNLLAIRVRNPGKNSRWYSGSGIYREVRLDVLPATARIARWGVGAWTRQIAGGVAEVQVTTRIVDPEPQLRLVTRLRDAAGRVVASAASAAGAEVTQTLGVRGARLWSPASPYLYVLETELLRGELVVDRASQPCGVRIVAFDPKRGMTINGAAVKLRGACIHHDNGLLGACAFRDADERRVRLLQARGYNAIRSTHNTASRSLRETCDRLGMLLIDEAFDMWHVGKNPDDFSTRFNDHWREVLESMVLSARNSPSVVMWSIGNEIPRRTTPEGVEWSWTLANAVRRLDPTRPVTAAIHGTLGPALIPGDASARSGRGEQVDNAATVFLDVPGYNYRLNEIELEYPEHPERVVYASETFARDMVDYARLSERAPYFLGEFLWTAADYIGEAALGRAEPIEPGTRPYGLPVWPYTGANCGDLDLTGAQKPPSLARDVVWGLSPVEVFVHRPLPAGTVEFVSNWGWPDEWSSWTWPGQDGNPLALRIFTAGDRVEVRLNGSRFASQSITLADKMQARIDVPYKAGDLEVIAYRGDRPIGSKLLSTQGAAARLLVAPERSEIAAGRQRLAFVRVSVRDRAGQMLTDDVRDLRVSLQGPAELIALGSGNPRWTGSLQASTTKTFRGEALAILRSTGKPGRIEVKAETEGLPAASAALSAS